MLIGGIEGGGTKFVCAVGDETGKIVERVSFPTREPNETLNQAKAFFDERPIEALGMGSFGPIDLKVDSDSYGTILNTPKTKWRNHPLLNRLKEDYSLPIFLDTDVNAACLGEYYFGSGEGVNSCLYITVGTGIGAGFVQHGQVYQGMNHSEMGHVFVKQHPDDSFTGHCPYHGNCLEGLAAGPAIEERCGQQGVLLPENHEMWEFEAYYLAQALINYTMILSPERIILGGGVMKQEHLLTLIREQFFDLLNGYLDLPAPQEFIVRPGLDDEQGVKGAIKLAVNGLV